MVSELISDLDVEISSIWSHMRCLFVFIVFACGCEYDINMRFSDPLNIIDMF